MDDTNPQKVGTWLEGLRWIEVDLHGLHDLADTLRADLDGHLRTATPEILAEHRTGVQFGASMSDNPGVLSARGQYAHCLGGGAEALLSYLEAAEAMIHAARDVAERYATAEARAQARAGEIDAALQAAEDRLRYGPLGPGPTRA